MRRRPSTPNSNASAGLETCLVCGRDFVQPVSWEPDGPERWWMFLRCGECGVSREVVVSNDEAGRFEAALHARAKLVARAVRELEEERISSEVADFVTALEHDLIVPADFAA
jgi:hypothetical protein